MQDILTWLATPQGSTLVGGAVVMYVLLGLKNVFGWAPGTDAVKKQIAALCVSLVAGLALWGASGTEFEWGIWVTKAIEVFLGATTLHAVIPGELGGRSAESRAPGTAIK